MPNFIPTVIEKRNNSERAYDIFSRLLNDRIVMLDTDVNDYSASLIISQLLYLESEGPKKPINFFINSPGGVVTAGLGIYDTMQYISSPVHTYVIGQAASMGSLLAQSGEPGHRYIMPSACHMIHQPSGGAQGKVTDVEISLKEMQRVKNYLTQIYLDHNTAGKTFNEIAIAMDRDNWLTPTQAIEFGIADSIVTKKII